MRIELKNDGVVLRHFQPGDSQQIVRFMNNPRVLKNLRDRIPNPYTEKDAENFISYCSTEFPSITFAVEYKGELAGCIGLIPQDDVHRLSAEVGYWIGEPFWNRGIATIALRLISSYAFCQLGLVRLYSTVFVENAPSQRVLDKAGFTLDCVLKKAAVKNGRLVDECSFSLLNPDYGD